MGMSASQARMLSLTSRLSDLELKSQRILNSKTRLADESEAASRSYSDALDREKLKVYSSGNEDGAATYVDATAYNLTNYNAIHGQTKQRLLKDSYGRVLVSEAMAGAYQNSQAADGLNTFINGMGYTAITSEQMESSGRNALFFELASDIYNARSLISTSTTSNPPITSTSDPAALQALLAEIDEDSAAILDAFGVTTGIGLPAVDFNSSDSLLALYNYLSNIQTDGIRNAISTAAINPASDLGQQIAQNNLLTYDTLAAEHYEKVYNEIQENGGVVISDENFNSSDWLYAQLNAGNIFLAEWNDQEGENNQGDFVDTCWKTGDHALRVETDDTDVARAEAEYEVTMADIESKDKRFDLQLKQVDTEHNAIQTELESVKKVIDKNIDRSFKVFNA